MFELNWCFKDMLVFIILWLCVRFLLIFIGDIESVGVCEYFMFIFGLVFEYLV